MILLVDALPAGVTAATTIGALGPTIYVLAAGAGVIAIWFRIRRAVGELLDSRDGRKALNDALWGDNRTHSDAMWTFLKSDDFQRWLKLRIDETTSAREQALLARIEHLATSVEALTGHVERLVEKLDRREEDLRDLERRKADKS